MWNVTQLENAVRATFAGQRTADGCMPDRVQSDGVAVYSPGANDPAQKFADHAWDNGPFAALLLSAATSKLQHSESQKTFFCSLEPKVRVNKYWRASAYASTVIRSCPYMTFCSFIGLLYTVLHRQSKHFSSSTAPTAEMGSCTFKGDRCGVETRDLS